MYISRDNGLSWPLKNVIWNGKSAYCDITTITGGNVLFLFETGRILPYAGIALGLIEQKQITP